MSDDPHAPGNKGEASFMLAAELAITELRSQADEAATSAADAKEAAGRADKSASRWKKLTLVLAFFIVLSLTVGGVTGYFVSQTRTNADELRQQTITSCQSGNTFRTGQTEIQEKNYALQAQLSKANSSLLAQLITVLANGSPARIKQINSILAQSGKASAAEVKQFLSFVQDVNAPKNCQQAFENDSTGAKGTSSPTAGRSA